MIDIIETNLQFAYNPGDRVITTHCIVHHSAGKGKVEDIHRIHLGKGWAGIAYHFYVTKDGKLYRGRPINWTGGHTTGMNYCSIGICFEGNFELEEMPDAQANTGWELLDWLQKEYPGIIIGKHKDYNATACPGKNFPFEAITEPHVEAIKADELPEWAAEAWEWAKAVKIIDGTRPLEVMPRAEVITVLYRFAKLKGLIQHE